MYPDGQLQMQVSETRVQLKLQFPSFQNAYTSNEEKCQYYNVSE